MWIAAGHKEPHPYSRLMDYGCQGHDHVGAGWVSSTARCRIQRWRRIWRGSQVCWVSCVCGRGCRPTGRWHNRSDRSCGRRAPSRPPRSWTWSRPGAAAWGRTFSWPSSERWGRTNRPPPAGARRTYAFRGMRRPAALRGQSIQAIAARWGFSSPTGFSRTFRATYDTTPNDYPLPCPEPAVQRRWSLIS